MSYDAIKIGDHVKVQFEHIEWIAGTVEHIPQATGECWVIRATSDVYYVQNFALITKDLGFQP